MRLVRAAMYGSMISDAERWEYSSRKWCSTDQTYLKPARSHATASSSSRMRRWCSAPAGSRSTSWRGTCAWTKSPNSMSLPPARHVDAERADAVDDALRAEIVGHAVVLPHARLPGAGDEAARLLEREHDPTPAD